MYIQSLNSLFFSVYWVEICPEDARNPNIIYNMYSLVVAECLQLQ